ncbi:hypothetical protein [Aquamicrobium sp.]|jgi:hypothetical protein|uniref:hypothetical protein n=1 Tax=Aquamicrobium sp. TaxID=1872579 RepID=UPI00258948B8|nr:hypothetical protein [Aquamicrobium sp.]MCK9550538.1 hypothetical protein [Aquamicrobium sp.]
MSIGALMGAALLLLIIQLSVRGKTYGTNRTGDVLPAQPYQDLVELAIRRGWSASARWTERLGHAQTILEPRDGTHWRYTLERWNSVLGDAVYGHSPRDSEWLDTSLKFPDGTVIIGPRESPEAIAFITGMLGFLQSDKGRGLANGLHKLSAGMKHLPNPAGSDMPFTLLSNLSAAPALPYDIVARNLRMWTARRPDKEEHPVITYQPGGLSVRLIRSTLDPVLTEELIDFANALRRDL